MEKVVVNKKYILKHTNIKAVYVKYTVEGYIIITTYTQATKIAKKSKQIDSVSFHSILVVDIKSSNISMTWCWVHVKVCVWFLSHVITSGASGHKGIIDPCGEFGSR